MLLRWKKNEVLATLYIFCVNIVFNLGMESGAHIATIHLVVKARRKEETVKQVASGEGCDETDRQVGRRSYSSVNKRQTGRRKARQAKEQAARWQVVRCHA